MNTKTPECWASEAQARGLRVELSADHSILLPHDEFAFGEIKRDGKMQTFRMVFAGHEVLICGHSLRRVETAMQRMELSFLTVLPGNQQSLIPDGQPVILKILVTELDSNEPCSK